MTRNPEGIDPNGDGFKGIFTDNYQHHNRFNISPAKHQIIPQKTTAKISSMEEFIDLWKKCEKSTQFLKFSIEINELTIDS